MPATADLPAAKPAAPSAVDPDSPRGLAIAAVRDLKARDPAVAAVLGPGETDVEVSEREDHAGDPAYYAVVVIPDEEIPREKEEATWDAFEATSEVIWESLRAYDADRWPYVRFLSRETLDAPPEEW